MIYEVIEVNYFTEIRSILDAEFGNNHGQNLLFDHWEQILHEFLLEQELQQFFSKLKSKNTIISKEQISTNDSFKTLTGKTNYYLMNFICIPALKQFEKHLEAKRTENHDLS